MNLRHKLAYTALGGMIAVCGMLSTTLFSTATDAQSGDAVFDTITARQLKIVNDDGKPVVELNTLEGAVGGLITLNDDGGFPRISLVAGDNGSMLTLRDNDGTYRINLFALGEESGLAVRDNDGELAARIAARKQRGHGCRDRQRGQRSIAWINRKHEQTPRPRRSDTRHRRTRRQRSAGTAPAKRACAGQARPVDNRQAHRAFHHPRPRGCGFMARQHTAPVNAVAFSPDSNMLVSGSDANAVELWDTSWLNPVVSVQPIPEDVNGDGVVNILDLVAVADAISADGAKPESGCQRRWCGECFRFGSGRRRILSMDRYKGSGARLATRF